MGAKITKTFSVDVIFSRDDEETLCITDLNYTQMLAELTKRITEQAEASMGIVSSHIVGDVAVT